MKKSTSFFCCLLITCSVQSLFSQGHWEVINRQRQVYDLSAVQILSPTRAIAAGPFGTVRLTQDGGATFSYPESGSEHHLDDIAFFDTSTGLIVGRHGTIVRTSDAGVTWSARETPISDDLLAIATDADMIAVAVGINGALVISDNGGMEWKAVSSATADSLFSVAGNSQGTFIAAGKNGTVVRSTDGGKSWTPLNSGTQTDIRAVAFAGDRWYIAGYDGSLYSSLNEGQNWTKVPDAGAPFQYARIQFFSAERGVRSGYGGFEWDSPLAIQFTTNGGQSWQTPSGLDVNAGGGAVTSVGPDISFLDEDLGMSAGINGSMKRYEREQQSGPYTSTILSGYTTSYWTDIHCSDSMHCVAVGYRNEFGNGGYRPIAQRTTDGGQTWQEMVHPLRSGSSSPPRTPVLRSVYSPDGTNITAVGDSGIYLQSTDGLTFERKDLGLDLSRVLLFEQLSFSDAMRGIMMSGGDLILTEDGGKTWRGDSISEYRLALPYIIDPSTIFLISPFDFHRSTDFGETWSRTDYRSFLSEGMAFSSIVFTDDLTGWILGSYQENNQGQRANTLLLKTTDGGKNWATVLDEELPGAEFGMRALDFADARHGLMVGTRDKAYITSDFGETWSPVDLPVQSLVFGSLGFIATGVSFPSPGRAFAVSNTGEMLRYTAGTSGAREHSTNSVASVLHWSIAPNPARDEILVTVEQTGRIRAGEATATVSDITGRIVREIPFPQRGVGDTFTLRFETKDLTEGTYIVRLEAGGISESRLLQVVR